MKQQAFDPGLTQQFTGELRRAINKDGTFNVHRRGTSFQDLNFYLYLIDTSWTTFIVIVTGFVLALNVLFATLYMLAGAEHLRGIESEMGVWVNAFFFSVHTLTTVGYGNLYPVGLWSNTLSAVEAVVGLLGFAVITGLLYGRFSRPSARIRFSENMLMAPYQDGTSLQFRVANGRSNTLMDLEARMLLMTVERVDGVLQRKYAALELERKSVYFFPLTWTVVHPIDEASPLYKKTAQDLAQVEAEVLILIKGFDDTFSQVVHARYSYRHEDIVWGAKFVPAFRIDPAGDMVLEVDRISDLKRVAS
jgi:inward rectifier potassium channel